MSAERRVAVVALGSNLGDSASTLNAAMDRLAAFSVAPPLRSSLWRTVPVECPPGSPDFLNAVVVLAPWAGETPETLLEELQGLERLFGRRPKVVLNEARELDLDLIVFGDEVRTGERLVLPHPRAHQRRFVLAPLCEVVPELVLPGQEVSVAELLAGLTTEEVVERLGRT